MERDSGGSAEGSCAAEVLERTAQNGYLEVEQVKYCNIPLSTKINTAHIPSASTLGFFPLRDYRALVSCALSWLLLGVSSRSCYIAFLLIVSP